MYFIQGMRFSQQKMHVCLINFARFWHRYFLQIDEYSNRVAHYFIKSGFKKGDTVALFMENRPEYVAIWLGLAKAGFIPALINYNLKHQVLVHTIKIAKSVAIIYGAELQDCKLLFNTQLTQQRTSLSLLRIETVEAIMI